MDRDEPVGAAKFDALLEHLTGPARSTVDWLPGKELFLSVGPERRPLLSETLNDGAIARLSRDGDAVAIEALNDHTIWINKRVVGDGHLRDKDVIEFGETGPISRFRRFQGHAPMRWTVNEMAGDTLAYIRSSRRPLSYRLSHATRDFLRRFLVQTTLVFRLTVLIALGALGWLAYSQYQTNLQLTSRLVADANQIKLISADVAAAQRTALRPEDLTSLRQNLDERFSSNIERLSALERTTGATARVIAEAASSVVFLQGAYGLRSSKDGRMLRYVLGANGRPLASPTGRPRLSLEGKGAVAEIQFTGTGFLLEGEAVVVTNRHVAVPWEDKSVGVDMEPTMIRFIGWLPEEERAFDAALLVASDIADLALVSLADAPVDRPGLRLAAAPPPAGSEVVVMGYPTGLRAMLAKSGADFVKSLQEEKDVGFWSVAERLAKASLIAPLASRGIVGQVADEALVYDAETTSGGSGGPVLNSEGEVVAVNAAILPEYGGSNLGVPIAKLKALLAAR